MIVPPDPNEPLRFEHRYFLRKDYRDASRLDVAFRLALDVETCEALLSGLPVAPGRIDADALAWALEKSHVQLVAPIDVLEAA